MSASIIARGAPPPLALARRPACGRLHSVASLGPQALFPSRALDGLLLCDGALARALPRACVGPRPLAAHREVPAMAHAAEAANLHEALDVHRDLLAEIAFDTPLLLDDA